MTIAYTPEELRTLAGSQRTNPFFVSQVCAALVYAADALEAADKALTAELERAKQSTPAGQQSAAINPTGGTTP